VLKDLSSAVIETSARTLKINQSTFVDSISLLEGKMRPVIQDTRPKITNQKPLALLDELAVISSIFDNPVISLINTYNPLNFLVDSVVSELEDLITIPDIGSLMSSISDKIGSLMGDEFNNILRFLEDFADKAAEALEDPSQLGKKALEFLEDTFWTLWDAIKKVFVAAYEMMVAIFEKSSE
jgi:hypothetical protein